MVPGAAVTKRIQQHLCIELKIIYLNLIRQSSKIIIKVFVVWFYIIVIEYFCISVSWLDKTQHLKTQQGTYAGYFFTILVRGLIFKFHSSLVLVPDRSNSRSHNTLTVGTKHA